MKTKVLIVDDQALYRMAIAQHLRTMPSVELVGQATDGHEGLALVRQETPDIVVLDFEMPNKNGLEFLRELKQMSLAKRPKVIVFSAQDKHGADTTMEALSLGAADFVAKPTSTQGADAIKDTLLPRIAALSGDEEDVSAAPVRSLDLITPRKLLVIASSTGGPAALKIALANFPASFAIPIVIVQHMPPLFTTSFAETLNANISLSTAEAKSGEALLPGKVYITPGDFHMNILQSGNRMLARLNKAEPRFNLRPAADVTFEGLSTSFGDNVIVAEFTGMGCDGAAGCQALSRTKAAIITQTFESCTVSSMPKSVVSLGLSQLQFTPESFYETVCKFNLSAQGGR